MLFKAFKPPSFAKTGAFGNGSIDQADPPNKRRKITTDDDNVPQQRFRATAMNEKQDPIVSQPSFRTPLAATQCSALPSQGAKETEGRFAALWYQRRRA